MYCTSLHLYLITFQNKTNRSTTDLRESVVTTRIAEAPHVVLGRCLQLSVVGERHPFPVKRRHAVGCGQREVEQSQEVIVELLRAVALESIAHATVALSAHTRVRHLESLGIRVHSQDGTLDLVETPVVASFLARRLKLARRIPFVRGVVDAIQATLVCCHVPLLIPGVVGRRVVFL